MMIMPYGWPWPIAAAHRPGGLLVPRRQVPGRLGRHSRHQRPHRPPPGKRPRPRRDLASNGLHMSRASPQLRDLGEAIERSTDSITEAIADANELSQCVTRSRVPGRAGTSAR
jgi:hypothetical protein